MRCWRSTFICSVLCVSAAVVHPQDLFAPLLNGMEAESLSTFLSPVEIALPISPATARIRVLDKRLNYVSEHTISTAELYQDTSLSVALTRCQPPASTAAESIAWLEVTQPSKEEPVFAGWMFSEHPFYAALQHPRYDIWLLSCKILE